MAESKSVGDEKKETLLFFYRENERKNPLSILVPSALGEQNPICFR